MEPPRVTWAAWRNEQVAILTKNDLYRLLQDAREDSPADVVPAAIGATEFDVLESTHRWGARVEETFGLPGAEAEAEAWLGRLRHYHDLLGAILAAQGGA